MIDIQKLLLPSRAIELQATALDTDGAQGLVAEVFSSKAWSIAGAMAGSFISGLASAQQTQSIGALGFTQAQPTGRNALLQGVAQTAADQSKRLVEEATAEKPVLVVERGTAVSVLIQGEVRF
jgi:type IV secretory pathway VirB10-like protein